MSQPIHTFGPTCQLARKVAFSTPSDSTEPPAFKAQYFYASPLHIDDPLAVIPIPTGTGTTSAKHPVRPFSPGDNEALESAWLTLTSSKASRSRSRSLSKKERSSNKSHARHESRTQDSGEQGGDGAQSDGRGRPLRRERSFLQKIGFKKDMPEDAGPSAISKHGAADSTAQDAEEDSMGEAMKAQKSSGQSDIETTAGNAEEKSKGKSSRQQRKAGRSTTDNDSVTAKEDSPKHRKHQKTSSADDGPASAEKRVEYQNDDSHSPNRQGNDSCGCYSSGEEASSEGEAQEDTSQELDGAQTSSSKEASSSSTREKKKDSKKASSRSARNSSKPAEPWWDAGYDNRSETSSQAAQEHESQSSTHADPRKGTDEARASKSAKQFKKVKFSKPSKREASMHTATSGDPENDEIPQGAQGDEDDLCCDSCYVRKPSTSSGSRADSIVCTHVDRIRSSPNSRAISSIYAPSHIHVRRSRLESNVCDHNEHADGTKSRADSTVCNHDQSLYSTRANSTVCTHDQSITPMRADSFVCGHDQSLIPSRADSTVCTHDQSVGSDLESDGCPDDCRQKSKETEAKRERERQERARRRHTCTECLAQHNPDGSNAKKDRKTMKSWRGSKGKAKQESGDFDLEQADGADERPLSSKLSEAFRSAWPEKRQDDKTAEPAGPDVEKRERAASSVSLKNPSAGTTGQPFVKLPSRRGSEGSSSLESDQPPPPPSRKHERDSTEDLGVPDGCKSHKKKKGSLQVPVGTSRLHQVSIPDLQMGPIYWKPVHDEALVIRGTWFYRDSMLPVEIPVANQLETGYRELKPWSTTWNDELNSAIDVGAAGEEKIAHDLWPKDQKHPGISHTTLSSNPYCAPRTFDGEAAAEGIMSVPVSDEKPDSSKSTSARTIPKKYPNGQVIYKDAENAFILKPNLQPSAYYNRKPLSKIRKGITVGLHVVRGFDWKVWEKLHPSKLPPSARKAEQTVPASGTANANQPETCPACRSKDDSPKVTDLIMVIHGIGQELAKTMESFNFTHSINALRRSINLDLASPAIASVLREDLGGMMVLPVNWRTNLSFEDDKKAGHRNKKAEFSLRSITLDSIPAVRSVISDVMLDIPYYMSHHKDTMISAVTTEANRVYRLWCKNNPGFQDYGRVHMIAHSLGSVMALEILSKQPNVAPIPRKRAAALSSKSMNSKTLDFNTKNLFLAGSPAGFFLYLEKGRLLPRRGQNKPGAEPSAGRREGVAGDADTFGCLAVDNVYNIMHYTDPIAYRLNATVDPQWAANLKTAEVPSATTGVFTRIGAAFRGVTPGYETVNALGIVKPNLDRLPSSVEMEEHDFTAEENAETKFSLLNDNGQIDYYLKSGGGSLDFEYLSMIGAHGSYWTSPDFTRMVVVECGRKPGKNNALTIMRAKKISQR